MIDFKVEVKGDRELVAHLKALPDKINDRLLSVVESLTKRLLEGVRSAEPMRTGRLRAATRSSVTSSEDVIRGKVTIGQRAGDPRAHDIAAAALEYGVHSAFTVRLHNMRMTTYTRRVSISARRFLRDPFERMKPIALAEIARALSEPEP